MERAKKIIADAVFAIQILIIFVLLFESRIVAPALLQSFGRLHPLLLHLPIGLLVVTVVLFFIRKYFDGKSVDELSNFLLHVTALTASLTTLMGLFLSLEGSFGEEQLWLHKWLGVALSFLCWGLLAVKNDMRILKPVGVAGVVLLILTGHYGANLTHGEDFVWAPLQQEEPRVARVITDSTSLFAATIEPIFESKCIGCHNPKKAKGDLVLTSLEQMRKGGETGPLWKAADPSNSLLVERIMLPVDHDDHMPPKDKAQLTEDEIAFISLWIDAGADAVKKLGEVAADDTLGKLASAIIPRYQTSDHGKPTYTFRYASTDKIRELSIPNRTVFQIARNEPAIQADFFLRENYERKHLEELLVVKEQLISLNLSKMPVADADLGVIAKFENLETLNLNNTGVTADGIKSLRSMPRLKSLSLSGTAMTAAALREIGKMTSLKEVFIWNTGIAVADVETLQKEFPGVAWNIGFVPDTTEILKLNPPMLKNKSNVLNADEEVVLKHSLPGTTIRYAVDESEPDSVNSPVFDGSLKVKDYAMIRTKAFKEGWLTSDIAEFVVFRKGHKPDTAVLETQPDERFQGEGAATLLDGKKGLADFYRHPAWMAFKDNDLVLSFSFTKEAPTIRNITLSFAHHNRYVCLPPKEMQLWGGDNPDAMRLLGKVNPPEVEMPRKARIEGLSMEIPPSRFKYYKLVATPVRKRSDGEAKDRTLWLMVDEVFIN